MIKDEDMNTRNTMLRIISQLILLPLSLLILSACQGERPDAPAPDSSEETFTLRVGTQLDTRTVSLAEDQRTVTLTWPQDDVRVLHVFFRQDGALYSGGLLSPTWLRDDLLYAEFTISLHKQMDPKKPFDLIGVIARRVDFDGKRILVGVEAHPLYAVSAASDLEITDVPTYFAIESVDLQSGIIPEPELRHLGSLAVVWVKNSSALPLDLAGVGVLPEKDQPAFYHKGALPFVGNEEIPYLDLLDPEAKPVMKHSRVIYPRTTIAAGESAPMGFWLRPLDGATVPPQSRVALYEAEARQTILSQTALSQRAEPLRIGQAYHIYTTWDGKSLQVTKRL